MASQEKTVEFRHIESLMEGEPLRLKMKLSVKRPVIGDTVYVYRLLDVQKVDGLDDSGSRIRRHDFTALVEDSDGELLEFAYDSRHFERVA